MRSIPSALRGLKFLPALALLALCTTAFPAAEDKKEPEKIKPIRALLITGGCCHDYEMQKQIITEGTAARAHIDWVVVHQGGKTTNTRIPLHEDKDWAKNFDIVVHNECFSDVKDPKWTETILRPHRDGTPAVVIHCAMHCYRDGTGEWFKFVGVTSHQHGAHYPVTVVNRDKKHPVLAGFGDEWKTRAGELYQIAKIGENCHPLATARSKETGKDEVCIWTNQFGKARVFGTTIGHYNQEMTDPVYLEYLTRGILWACDKLDDRYLKPFDPSKHKFRWETPKETKEPPPAKDKKP